jgi:uncharacterized delta-60 repeat protein
MVAAAALASSLAFVPVAQAAEGDLDPSFGVGGTVTTPIGTSSDFGHAAVIDSQGRIVVAGESDSGSHDDFALARYNPNGSLDTSFNGTGKVTTPIAAGENFASAVTIDAQGRIIAAGRSATGVNYDFALARYNPNGSLDTSFNGTGKVTRDLFGADDVAAEVAIDPQGRIVVAGTSRAGGDDDFSVARFDASGNLDTSFSGSDGSPGFTNVDFTPVGADEDTDYAMAIDGQGRIVLAGETAQPSGTDFALARLNSDGSRDATFGTNAAPKQGQVTTPIGSGIDTANAVAIDPQGRIVAAGSSYNGFDFDFALVRYNPNGSLDTSFDGTGKVTTAVSSNDDDRGNAAAIDSQGRIVVAGTSDGVFALARYNPNGRLDTSLGGTGVVATPIGALGGSADAVAIDAQDRIVAAGYAQGVTNNDFALARYIGDAVAPSASIDSGLADGSYTNNTSPSFAFSSNETGASFSCGFDGLTASCASPFTPPTPLGDGPHTFSLTATDRAGNTSAATTRSFTVDTKAPTVTIKGKAKLKTRKRKARERLKINVSEAAIVTCAIDKRKPGVCGAKYRTPKLKRGKHRLTVTATDQAGNTATAGKNIRVVRKRRR